MRSGAHCAVGGTAECTCDVDIPPTFAGAVFTLHPLSPHPGSEWFWALPPQQVDLVSAPYEMYRLTHAAWVTDDAWWIR